MWHFTYRVVQEWNDRPDTGNVTLSLLSLYQDVCLLQPILCVDDSSVVAEIEEFYGQYGEACAFLGCQKESWRVLC